MKKRLAIVLVLAMMFALGACGNTQEDVIVLNPQGQKNTENVQNVQDYTQDVYDTEDVVEETPEVEITVQENTQVHNQNYFYNDTNYFYDLNTVSVKPRYVYWENGMLIAECFVINGFDVPVYNVNVDLLEFSNSAGKFAGAAFGTLQGASIAPYSYIVWTFTFPADCVFSNNADLTGVVNTAYKTNYSY